MKAGYDGSCLNGRTLGVGDGDAIDAIEWGADNMLPGVTGGGVGMEVCGAVSGGRAGEGEVVDGDVLFSVTGDGMTSGVGVVAVVVCPGTLPYKRVLARHLGRDPRLTPLVPAHQVLLVLALAPGHQALLALASVCRVLLVLVLASNHRLLLVCR